MKWKCHSTSESVSVDAKVDLDEFRTASLLQELVNRGIINETEAAALLARESEKEPSPLLRKNVINAVGPIDEESLSVALEYAQRHNRAEALIHLERALGRDWNGMLS